MQPNITIISPRRAIALALPLILAAAVSWAHGGFEHVMGTVTKITPQSVTVSTAGNKLVEVVVNDKTTYARGTQKVAAADLKVGDRVVIDAMDEEPKLVAASVKIGATAAASHDEHSHK